MENSVNQQKSNKKILLILTIILVFAIGAASIWYFSQKAVLEISSDADITLSYGSEKIKVKANKVSIIDLSTGKYEFLATDEKYNFTKTKAVEIKSQFDKESISFSFSKLIKEEDAISAIRNDKTIAGYKKYLADYPEGKYAAEADKGVSELTSEMDSSLVVADENAFKLAKQKSRVSAFKTYKEEFPKGIYVNEANEQIKILEQLDKESYELAKSENTVGAFELYLKKNKEGLFVKEAKTEIKKIKNLIALRKKDNQAYEKAKEENTIEGFKAYIKEFAKGLHTKEANTVIKKLEDEAHKRWIANEEPIWQRAIRTEKNSDYKKYIDTYPRGKYISEAKNMLALLEKEQKFQLKAPPGFKYIEGGNFDMGSRKGSGDESPVHSVKLPSFYMSKYEVTNKQYATFLNEYGSDVVKSGEAKGQAMIYTDEWGVTFDGNEWKAQEGYDKHPVVYVTWYGANEYCAFYKFRLPTEAEWEFAAFGGIKAKKKYTFSGSNSPKAVAWYYDNSSSTMRVGRKGANNLGIYDMTGNVWEWVNDWHEKNYYSRSPKIAPKGPSAGSAKVLRGGSFFEITKKLRTTYRDFSYPIIGYYNYGFRPVKEVKE